MPQNIISSFLILVKLRVDICILRAKIGFPGRRSSCLILKASNFGTMTFTMGTISHYPKMPIKGEKSKNQIEKFHFGQKSVRMQKSASILKFPKWTMKGPKMGSMPHCEGVGEGTKKRKLGWFLRLIWGDKKREGGQNKEKMGRRHLLPNFFNYLSWIESQTPVSHQIA